jgi:hypothetical protein
MHNMRVILGFLIAAALLPWGTASGADSERVESFFIQLPIDGIALTHSGDMVLGAGPPGIALLTEERVRNGLALLVKIRDGNDEVVGFASELETFPEGKDVLREDVIWDTDWTLMIPGRGSLYLRQQEHSRGLGPKIIVPVRESGVPWRGEWKTTTTTGPRADGHGVIVGGAGEFEGVTGRFLELITLTGYEPQGVMIGRVELRLFFED